MFKPRAETQSSLSGTKQTLETKHLILCVRRQSLFLRVTLSSAGSTSNKRPGHSGTDASSEKQRVIASTHSQNQTQRNQTVTSVCFFYPIHCGLIKCTFKRNKEFWVIWLYTQIFRSQTEHS